jgi:outer membrane receptor protein involved in Fe transport
VDDGIVTAPYGKGSAFPGVLFTNAGRITTYGVEAKVALRLWILHLEGTATYLIQQDNDGTTLDQYPRLCGNGGIYFWSKVLQNKLEIKAGFRGRFQSSHVGAEFNPEILAYVPGRGPKLGAGSSADFFLITHIGDAYIHLMWENLTNVQYNSTPFYPVLDRAVRFGISWEFLN